MGLRFRRSLRIARGLRVNLSTRGVSVSMGGRGTTVNIGPQGIRHTLGLPGTGLSYSTLTPWGGRGPRTNPSTAASGAAVLTGFKIVAYLTLAVLAIVFFPVTLVLILVLIVVSVVKSVGKTGGTPAPSPLPSSGAGQASTPQAQQRALVTAYARPASAGLALGHIAPAPATLPPLAVRKIAPLLAERRRLESRHSSGNAMRIAEIDAELARLYADVSTNPWRYAAR